jgi:hypothetical protein
MKTSWNSTNEIEQYLFYGLKPEDKALFETRLILEPSLKENMHWQQATYTIVKEYGRQKLREEIDQVAHHIFTSNRYKSFREKVFSFFIN